MILRVGALVDDLVVDAWAAAALAEVEECDSAQLALLVVNAEPLPNRSLRRLLRHLLYFAYQGLDRARNAQDDPFARVDITGRFPDAKLLRVVPIRTGRVVHRFDEASLEAIRGERLDVLLRFGFGIVRGEILAAAAHGVWSYHHGDNRRYRGGPSQFWELYEGEPITGTVLQVLTEELDAGGVIYRSSSEVDPVSLQRTRRTVYWNGVPFVRRRLDDLARHGPDFIESLETYREPATVGVHIYRHPTNRQMLVFLARLVSRVLRRYG
jgi:hypothetical protein